MPIIYFRMSIYLVIFRFSYWLIADFSKITLHKLFAPFSSTFMCEKMMSAIFLFYVKQKKVFVTLKTLDEKSNIICIGKQKIELKKILNKLSFSVLFCINVLTLPYFYISFRKTIDYNNWWECSKFSYILYRRYRYPTFYNLLFFFILYERICFDSEIWSICVYFYMLNVIVYKKLKRFIR